MSMGGNQNSSINNTATITSDNGSDESVLSSESSDQDSDKGGDTKKAKQRKTKKPKQDQFGGVSTFITSAETRTRKPSSPLHSEEMHPT